jgi:hypothetical protein
MRILKRILPVAFVRRGALRAQRLLFRFDAPEHVQQVLGDVMRIDL